MVAVWDSRAVQANLKPFDIYSLNPLTESERQYCQYYGIDYDASLPVRQSIGYYDVQGFRIALHYFRHQSAKATVLVMHGYYDHVGLYKHLIGYLLEQGYSVVAYDLPGHGLSTGQSADIKSFAHYQSVLTGTLRLIRGGVKLPLMAVAQSTGAAVLADYYLTFRHNQLDGAFKSIVMLAPLIRPVGWKRSKLTHSLLRPFFKTWKRAFRNNSSDSVFLSFLRENDPLQSKVLSVDWVSALKEWIPRVEKAKPVDMPLTIIQGEDDGTVDWRHNVYTLNKKFRKPSVYYIEGAEHHLVNESEEIREKIFSIVGRTFSAVVEGQKVTK